MRMKLRVQGRGQSVVYHCWHVPWSWAEKQLGCLTPHGHLPAMERFSRIPTGLQPVP